jgi:CheY-like chemotaxis protein
VLEWVRDRPELAELPSLVLSSSAHEEDVSRARHLGARNYHVKPSDLTQLTQLARELGAKWLHSKILAESP